MPDIIGLCEIEVGRRNNFVSKNNEGIQNYLPAAHTAGQRGILLVPEKKLYRTLLTNFLLLTTYWSDHLFDPACYSGVIVNGYLLNLQIHPLLIYSLAFRVPSFAITELSTSRSLDTKRPNVKSRHVKMKQWRILVIVLGVIILLLVANFRYILRVYFDSSKYYILFHSISGLLFFLQCADFVKKAKK